MTKARLPIFLLLLISGAIVAATTLPGIAQHGDGLSTPGRKAPELQGPSGNWLNSKPTTIAANKGKVIVLTFWTFGCINCKRTLPFWNTWARRYAETDVTVLSVHTPELEFERKPENVRAFLKEKGIVFPVLTDNDYRSWRAFGVQAWPTTILIDKQGRIRGRWEGELDWNNSGEYTRVEQAIEALRKEKS